MMPTMWCQFPSRALVAVAANSTHVLVLTLPRDSLFLPFPLSDSAVKAIRADSVRRTDSLRVLDSLRRAADTLSRKDATR